MSRNFLVGNFGRIAGPITKEKARLEAGLLPQNAGMFLPVILPDQMVDDAVGFVDVVDGAIAQAPDGRIIFLAGNVVMRLVEQFEGAVKAAGAIHVRIDGRMVVQILAVVDGGALDFVDRFVDFLNGVLLFVVHMLGRRQLAEVSARVPQVSESVQVGGMPSRFVSERQGGANGNNKHEYGTMACGFHSLL
jgi:hypothetical protein